MPRKNGHAIAGGAAAGTKFETERPQSSLRASAPQAKPRDARHVVAEIRRNACEAVRVEIATAPAVVGGATFGIRDLLRLNGAETLRPGGFGARIELLPKLIAALQEAERQARAAGLLPEVERGR